MKTKAAVREARRSINLSRQDLFNRAAESTRWPPRETEPDAICECGEAVSYENWRRHLSHKLAN